MQPLMETVLVFPKPLHLFSKKA